MRDDYVGQIKDPVSRMLGNTPLFFTFNEDENVIVPHDQGGFILPPEAWADLKTELDAFYAHTPTDEIHNYNQGMRTLHGLDCDCDLAELGGRARTANRGPRADDYKIRRRLIRERGLKCEDCSDELTKRTVEMHHIIRVVDGGTSIDSNLKLLCHECHLKYRLPCRSRTARALGVSGTESNALSVS